MQGWYGTKDAHRERATSLKSLQREAERVLVHDVGDVVGDEGSKGRRGRVHGDCEIPEGDRRDNVELLSAGEREVRG